MTSLRTRVPFTLLLVIQASLLLILLCTAFAPRLRFSQTTITTRTGVSAVRFPHDLFLTPHERALVRSKFFYRALQGENLVLRSNACLQQLSINERVVAAAGMEPSKTPCLPEELVLSQKSVLREGLNDLQLLVVTRENPLLHIDLFERAPRRSASAFGAALLAALLLAQALRRARYSLGEASLLAGGLLLRLLYLSATPYDTRTYDVTFPGGHLDYIKWTAENGLAPPPHDGWESHQPPLYYLLAGAVYRLSLLSGSALGHLPLQLFSVLCSMVFLLCGATIAREVIWSRRGRIVAVLVLAAWPSLVLHSPRIGNDGLAGACAALALLCMVRHESCGGKLRLLAASLWAALGVTAKLTAVSLLGPLLRLAARTGKGRTVAVRVVAVLLPLTGLLATAWDNHAPAAGGDLLLGHSRATIHPGLQVPNGVENYLCLPLRAFLTRPFTDTWQDTYGRECFGYFLLKSSLWGEFTLSGVRASRLATAQGVLLLGLLIAPLALVTRRIVRPAAVLLLAALSYVTVLVIYRLITPYSPAADFRYITPVLLALAPAVGTVASSARSPLLRGSTVGVVLLFAALSVALVFEIAA